MRSPARSVPAAWARSIARDTRLRDVALKFLPDAFATDPERLARFRREAQLLAALNHPHIATIHGLEEASDSLFLVMELVEGDTLADRLARGAQSDVVSGFSRTGLPLEETLTIARQAGLGSNWPAALLRCSERRAVCDPHRDTGPNLNSWATDPAVRRSQLVLR
jgi:serine/threonine protein kinase